jgi:hypothetical protein
MGLGPVFDRELLVAARRGGLHRDRVNLAALLLLIIGGSEVAWWLWYEGHRSIAEMARCAERTFALLVVGELLITLFVVPEMVARAIAEERERGTLEALLITRLSDAEILLGKAAAVLGSYLCWLATGVPVMVLLCLTSGVDPRLVLLSYPAIVTTAVLVGAMAVWVSLDAREVRRAIGLAVMCGWCWLFVPMFVSLSFPRFLRLLAPWVVPVNAWLLASSPAGVLLSLAGLLRAPGSVVNQVAWMMGLQAGAAALLLILALFRFRWLRAGRKPVRASWVARLREKRWRLWPRPECGENPVLWRELYTSPLDGLARVAVLVVLVPVLAIAAAATFFLARPAAQEVLKFGYGSLAHDDARVRLSLAVKGVFAGGFLLLGFIVSGYGAASIAAERTSTTWPSLMATALEGRAILRAKRIGSIWRARLPLVLLVVGALIGLVCGSVHPLGFLATLALMAAGLWFCAALGTYCSLKSRDLRQANNGTIGTIFLLTFSAAVFWALPPGWAAAPVAAGSLPCMAGLSVLSYPDFRALARGDFSSALTFAGVTRSVHTWGLCASYLIALLGHVVGAVLLVRAAERCFDRHVGRPYRDEKASARQREVLPREALAPAGALQASLAS